MSAKMIREALAALGVILSMLFVGLELRQNTLAVRATALNDLASASRDWLLAISSNPELTATMVRWVEGAELSPTETLAARSQVLALLRNTENVFLQVQAGAVEESALISYGFGGSLPFRSPHFPPFWAQRRDIFHPDFVAAFEAARGLD